MRKLSVWFNETAWWKLAIVAHLFIWSTIPLVIYVHWSGLAMLVIGGVLLGRVRDRELIRKRNNIR